MKLTISIALFALLLFSNCPRAGQSIEARLSPESQLSAEGYFNLHWQGLSEDNQMIIQQSSDKSFSRINRNIPTGLSDKLVISGLSDGIYYYRLYHPESKVTSNTATVKVEHRSLSDALKLFALGATIFVLLIAVMANPKKYTQKNHKR